MNHRTRNETYQAKDKAVKEYIQWYNDYHSRGGFATVCQERKREFADKNRIGVRTLERHLKQYYEYDTKIRFASITRKVTQTTCR